MERTPLLAARPALTASEVRALREGVLAFSLGMSFGSAIFFSMRTDYTLRVLHAGDPATIGVLAIVSFYVTHAMSNPVLGKVSDRVGRKPFLLLGSGAMIAVFGSLTLVRDPVLFVALFALLGAVDSSNAMYHLVVVDTIAEPLRSADDDSGGVFAFFARRAGVDDPAGGQDDPQRRLGVIFSAVYVCSMVAATVGFAAAVALENAVGIVATVGAAALAVVPFFLYMLVSLPETAPGRAGPALGLADAVVLVCHEQWTGLQLLLATARRRWLLLATFAEHAAIAGAVSIVIYWAVFKFGFGIANQTAVLVVGLAAAAAGTALLQGGLIPALGLSGPRACVLLVAAASLLAAVLAAAFEPWMAYVGVLAVGSAGMNPEIRSQLTADVDRRNQGFLQGALQTVNSVGDALGAALVLLVYDETADDDIAHDSHRARHMVRANTIWHVVLALNALVALALLQVDDAAAPAVAPVAAVPVDDKDKGGAATF